MLQTSRMLRALLKTDDEPPPKEVPKPCPVGGSDRTARQRAKPFQIYRLFPAELGPADQAAEMLAEIQTHSPDAMGQYVPASDLQRFYLLLAKQRGWPVKSWHVIGREFGRLCTKINKKEDGRRFKAYRIPRMTQPSP